MQASLDSATNNSLNNSIENPVTNSLGDTKKSSFEQKQKQEEIKRTSTTFKSFFKRTGEKKGLEKINTLTKIMISFLASIFTIVYSTPEGLLCLFFFSLLYALFLPEPKIILYAYVFTLCMFTIATTFAYVLSLAGPIPFSVTGMINPFLRLLVMLHVILPLACSTRIQDILTSLKSLRLPFFIYLPSAVMIRFIPTFMSDVKQVAETLKIRGYALSVLETTRHPITMIRLLFTPLLFRSLRSSEDLGIAAELKGMNAQTKITKYRTEPWHKKDTLLLCLVLLVFALSVFVEVYLGTPLSGGHK